MQSVMNNYSVACNSLQEILRFMRLKIFKLKKNAEIVCKIILKILNVNFIDISIIILFKKKTTADTLKGI